MDEKQRKQARLRKQKQRDKKKENSVTLGSVTQERDIEMVPAMYTIYRNGDIVKLLPERPRYLELSDGQVLDRASAPVCGYTYEEISTRLEGVRYGDNRG